MGPHLHLSIQRHQQLAVSPIPDSSSAAAAPRAQSEGNNTARAGKAAILFKYHYTGRHSTNSQWWLALNGERNHFSKLGHTVRRVAKKQANRGITKWVKSKHEHVVTPYQWIKDGARSGGHTTLYDTMDAMRAKHEDPEAGAISAIAM